MTCCWNIIHRRVSSHYETVSNCAELLASYTSVHYGRLSFSFLHQRMLNETQKQRLVCLRWGRLLAFSAPQRNYTWCHPWNLQRHWPHHTIKYRWQQIAQDLLSFKWNGVERGWKWWSTYCPEGNTCTMWRSKQVFLLSIFLPAFQSFLSASPPASSPPPLLTTARCCLDQCSLSW